MALNEVSIDDLNPELLKGDDKVVVSKDGTPYIATLANLTGDNVFPYIISGGTLTVTQNFGTGALSVTIPAGSRLLYGENEYVNVSQVALNVTSANSWRFLLFDTSNETYSLGDSTDRLNYVVIGVFPIYNEPAHRPMVNASIWSYNGISQTQNFGVTTNMLTNNVDTYIISPSSIPVTINYSTQEIGITIPTSSRVIYGNSEYVTVAPTTLSSSASTAYAFLIFDVVTHVFTLGNTAARLGENKITLGIFITYDVAHKSVLNASIWSLNGVSAAPTGEAGLLSSGFVPRTYGPYKSPTNTLWNYNTFISLKGVEGDAEKLKNMDGSFKELYLVFVRRKTSSPLVDSSIVQIAHKTGGSVGVGNVAAFSFFDDVIDMQTPKMQNGYLEGIDATGFGGVRLSMIIDWSKVPSSLLSQDLTNTLQINTELLYHQIISNSSESAKPLIGMVGVFLGDSVLEGNDYPQQVGKKTGAQIYNCGFGGCRMSKRLATDPNSLAYNEMAMYRVADAIATQDFTDMVDSAEYLRDNVSDDNTSIVSRLAGIDFDNVDFIVIAYGTNDYTGEENPIGVSGSLDVEEVRGALNYSIKTILDEYPHIMIIVSTPAHRYFGAIGVGDSDTYVNALSLKLINYVDGIISSADENHVPHIDMYRQSGFNSYNHTHYFVDGVHPNTTTGAAHYAKIHAAHLISLLHA